MDIADGSAFAGYRVERTLGSGGMGTVYLARHPRLPRSDALKVLSAERSSGERFRTAFLYEAEVAARLRHPNLVAVHDRGEYDGRLWIAMQYVPGTDLSGLLRRGGALEPARAVHILTEVARGLDELHRAGLLHRDVKPGNILIAEEPGRLDRVLVTDFGIARRADESAAAEGGFTGTLAYAAPEQLDDGAIDRRADVYALGCTLFQMLTGSLPFPRETPGSLIYAHLQEEPPRPSAVNPTVPAAFDAIVLRALAKRPDDRYAECGELAAAAQAALRDPVVSAPVAAKRFGRRRIAVAAVAFVTVAAALVAGALTWGGRSGGSSATPNRPITGTVEPAEWGAYAYVAEAFPDLLPATPFGGGYQELTGCFASDFTDKSGRAVPIGTSVAVPDVYCIGDADPVFSLILVCNADRKPMTPDFSVAKVEGDEKWSRPSGSGHLYWGTGALTLSGGGSLAIDDRALGVLDLYFDDPGRSFCRIEVYGNTQTGAELRAKWWPDAPL
ncbi:serine/threonine-protein kinase [Nocardia sp. NBC_00511]|uniref:serine/threonine-protein kinase n=1 Tax=Nocardia sp. NBC_00511 TaxID=2903591 RepID=UPI0030E22049